MKNYDKNKELPYFKYWDKQWMKNVTKAASKWF